MKWHTLFPVSITAFLLAPAVQAQSLVATYFNCDTADEDEGPHALHSTFDRRVDAE